MIVVAAGVIRRGAEVLLCSRPAEKPPAGWEFPGGKLEPDESAGAALERELREELDLAGAAGAELYVVNAPGVELHFIEFFPAPGSVPVPREGQSCAWVRLAGAMPPGLLPNDRPVWDFLVEKNR